MGSTTRVILPSRRLCTTQKLTIHGEKGKSNYYVTTDESLQEVFISVEKTGSEHRALLDCVGRLISVGLQYGIPLAVFTELLGGSKFPPQGSVVGHESIKFATSPLDLVSRYLEWKRQL